MSKIFKNTMAAVITSGLIMGTTVTAMAPTAASARTTYQCEVTKENSAKTGAVIGVVAGGLLGSQISKNERGLGAIGGAVIGGLLGNKLGRDQGKDTCNKAEAAMDRQRNEDRAYGYRSNQRYSSRNDRYSDNRYHSNGSRYGSRY